MTALITLTEDNFFTKDLRAETERILRNQAATLPCEFHEDEGEPLIHVLGRLVLNLDQERSTDFLSVRISTTRR